MAPASSRGLLAGFARGDRAPRGASGGDRLDVEARQRLGQVLARVDCELAEDVAQMPLHSAPAKEEPRSDLRIRDPITSQFCDLPLLGSQVVARRGRSL